jgi:hypothetical protein
MSDRSGVVELHNCVPINRIPLIDAQSGRIMTRPWTFAVNGKVNIQSFLDNGSILPNGELDVRNVAMGYDGILTTLPDGTELAHIFRFTITLDPLTDNMQPLRSRQRLTKITGFDVTLEFEEYVINDSIIMAKVIMPFVNPGREGDTCEAYLDFQGTIENRICV